MMNNEGAIALMKQALLFYAEEKNYPYSISSGNLLPIELDKGYQARFTLKQLEDLQKAETEFEIDYTNFKEPDTNLEDITQMIKDNL